MAATTDSERVRKFTLHSAALLFFAAIGFLIGRRVLGDNSFLTHFATGRLILDQGAVPTSDPYSFTANGEPWVVQSWLASLLYAGIDGFAGGFGIRVLHGALAGVSTGLVWKLTAKRNGTVFVPLALTSGVLMVGAIMWSARPLMFGLLGFVLVLCVLDGMIKPMWLLPIMWVWVNAHGSFPLAGVLVGTVGVGEWIDRREFPLDTAKILGWVTAGTLLGGINPLGPRLLWFPVQLLRRGEALDNVAEWQPFRLNGVSAWIFLSLVVLFVVSVSQRVEWRCVIPAAVFTLSALLAIRNLTVASVVLAVMAAPHLPLRFGELRLTDGGFVPRLLGAGSVALFFIAAFSAMSSPLLLDGYPVAEVELLESEGILDGDHRVLHPDIVGNYLGFTKGENANVFVDDRFDFYPQEVLDDFDVLLYGGDYEAVVNRYEPDAIVWRTGGGFEAWLKVHDDWTVAEPLEIDDEDADEPAASGWFIARPSDVVTPSPAVLASTP